MSNNDPTTPVAGQHFDFSKSMPLSVEQQILAVLERMEKLMIANSSNVTVTGEAIDIAEAVKPSREEQIAKLAQKTMGTRRR